MLFAQIDKLLLSTLLSCTEFGYYTIAWTLTSILQIFQNPISTVLFPAFCQRVAQDDAQGLSRLYHWGSQVISVTAMPTCMVTAMFAPQLLSLWVRNPSVVANTHLLVSLLMPGAIFGTLTYLPIMIQQAHGWTKPAFWIHVLSLGLLVPLIVLVTPRYGSIGAVVVWTSVRLLLASSLLWMTHRFLLRDQAWLWLRHSLFSPLLVSALAVTCCWMAIASPLSATMIFFTLVAVWSGATILTAIATPATAAVLRNLKLTNI